MNPTSLSASVWRCLGGCFGGWHFLRELRQQLSLDERGVSPRRNLRPGLVWNVHGIFVHIYIYMLTILVWLNSSQFLSISESEDV